MAERRSGTQPTVHLAYAFDRLLDAKLQNAYAILVPDRVHKIPAGAVLAHLHCMEGDKGLPAPKLGVAMILGVSRAR